MRISVITPTADQPLGMALAEAYMARQTVQPDEWIVADDGNEHAALTQGQIHLKLPRCYEGGRSLASNLLEALPEVTGDVVLVWEHDDWYSPEHIANCVSQLHTYHAAGSHIQRYYNVEHRLFVAMLNRGSALCNTALTADRLDHLKAAALQALETGAIGVDRLFWDSLPSREKKIHSINTVVGIKGLPGRKGLGVGHRPVPGRRRRWQADPNLTQLKLWVGQDYRNYCSLYS